MSKREDARLLGSLEAAAPFPVDFLWGASTSSYQIEGAAQTDGRGPSIWDTFCQQAGRVANGDTGDVACDHYHRFRDDVALMRDLGLRGYRFSIAWPRVLPSGRGTINEKGLAFYSRLIDALLEAEIDPWICLYHWDLPQALGDRGGWINRDTAGWFADYAGLIARRYGDRVKRFATFNEPSVFTLFGYAWGWHAPGIADVPAFLQSIHHVNLAHGDAVEVLRAFVPEVSIGCIHNRQPCLPESDRAEDVAAAATFDEYWNGAFPEPQHTASYPPQLAKAMEPYLRPGDLARISRPIDWFGLNHYAPHFIKADSNPLGVMFGSAPAEYERTAVGWPINPDAFRETLIDLHKRYRLPIYVMENGTACEDTLNESGGVTDETRIRYLAAYIGKMREAMNSGADVRGYFVWSLLDNFEWNSGYGPRFGIVYVDYATQRRIPKASARWYAALARGAT